MKKFILFILAALLMSVSVVSAQLNPDCANDSRRSQLGDYCITPLSEFFVDGIPGYYPLGAYLEFVDATGAGEMGRIYAYSWNVPEQRYHYLVKTRPMVGNQIYPSSDVAPEAILRASADIYQ
jgi:hypothetical protein